MSGICCIYVKNISKALASIVFSEKCFQKGKLTKYSKASVLRMIIVKNRDSS